jgi:Ca2+-binding RTX toxin-like protein
VVEASGAGTDTVLSSVSHVLASNVENLTLTGNASLNGDGSALNNVLSGNDGNNILYGLGGHDALSGGGGNDRLDGGSGNDALAGGIGADVLLGGSGNDVYLFGRGDGADTVQDTGGNTDVMSFLGGIEADQLWLRKLGSNLEISVIGTADKVTLSGWYSGYRIEEFKTADGKTLLDNDVQNLVQAMAAFAPPAAGQTTLPESYASALSTVIAANWQ